MVRMAQDEATTGAGGEATASAPDAARASVAPQPAGRSDADSSAPVGARVLIDATAMPAQLGGVGRYLEGLLQGFEEIGFVPWVVAKPAHVRHFRRLAPSPRYLQAPSWLAARGGRFGWEQVGLPQLAKEIGADVIHSPHYTFPLRFDGRRVVTIHDATAITDPETHSQMKSRFFSWWLDRGYRADVELIAPSQATVDEVTGRLGEPRRPVQVIHHGVDREIFRPPSEAEIAEFREAAGLGADEPWIAFLGTIEPRKQVPMLLRAHARLRAEDPSTPTLLVGGQRGWDAEATRLLDEKPEGVKELGYLRLEQLRSLLGGSELVVYASLAEGFGLPVLEAMQCAAPVLTTRATALPEVGGDVAAYVDATDDEALAAAIRELLADEAQRRERAAAGPARAAEFTWADAARAHVAAYLGDEA
ncbi:D-inositol 3-phosphate glycosyltransferase [Pseudoclavibacter triregionum]|nr:D-inositol 3-phosphate glycosyltransferase [Pseudoclavibacter triregionum]